MISGGRQNLVLETKVANIYDQGRNKYDMKGVLVDKGEITFSVL